MGDVRAHSRLGGSGATRWLNCSGSVPLGTALRAKGLAKRSSHYADDGNAAHELAKLCLEGDLHPRHFLGEFFEEWPDDPVTEEMCDAVVVYLNAVLNEKAQTPTAEMYVEQRFELQLSNTEPGEVFGSNDALIYHRATGRMVVFDYKHGEGIDVDVVDNDQLKFYAAGAALGQDWPLTEIELVIVQPRLWSAQSDDDRIKRWTFDVADLLDFIGTLEAGVERVKCAEVMLADGNGIVDPKTMHFLKDQGSFPHYKSGEHCRFCEGVAYCPLREEEVLEHAQMGFSDITTLPALTHDLGADIILPAPEELSLDRLSRVVGALAILKPWMRQCEAYLESMVLSGQPVPGWKPVQKLGRQKWDASAAENAPLEAEMAWGIGVDEIYPRKLINVGAVESLLRAKGATKEEIDTFKLSYITKESSGLTIAPESDPRPAVDVVQRAFGNIDTTSIGGPNGQSDQ